MEKCRQTIKSPGIFIQFAKKKNKEKYYKDRNSFRDVINYITGKSHPDKQVRYIGGYGINCDNIDQTIKMFKTVFKHCRHKKQNSNRKLYHLIMSFADLEFDVDIAHAIGNNVGKYLFIHGHQNIYAVHEDSDHTHIHIVFNSANIFDQTLFHATKYDRDLLRKKLEKIAIDTINSKNLGHNN